MLDLIEVEWSRESFSHALTCFYGEALPPGSDKESECGTGPFLVVVVEDLRPRRRLRRVSRRRWRIVNPAVWDARARYRAWTGGGYKIHASGSPEESERNLVLLFGRGTDSFRHGRLAPPFEARNCKRDLVGTQGFDDVDQLLLALEVTSGQSVIEPPPTAAEVDLAVAVSDLWWAEHVSGGRDVGSGVREIRVAGRPLRLLLVEDERA